MAAGADDGHGTLVPLPAPRPPSERERALLHALAAPLRLAALTEQVAQAQVVATCACGCPSVGLRSDAPPLDAGPRLIEATAVAPDGRELDVNLHLVLGQLAELEVWAGTWGGDPRSELPDPATLRPA